MVIGIIGAMDVEIENLLKHMEDVSTEKVSGIIYHNGTIGSIKVVAAVCGIGKVNAAICAQTMCVKYSPKYLINIGVAGSLSKELRVGDVVIASSVVQHDIDSTQIGFPFGFIPIVEDIHIKCSERLVNKLTELCDATVGVVATGDTFVSKAEDKDFIVQNFQAIAAEMEGGSIGHVCFVNGVEFVVIRCMSDNADDDSDVDFEENMNKSAQKSIELVVRLLEAL
jgi:adenosylhomocysteine nucleosidase